MTKKMFYAAVRTATERFKLSEAGINPIAFTWGAIVAANEEKVEWDFDPTDLTSGQLADVYRYEPDPEGVYSYRNETGTKKEP